MADALPRAVTDDDLRAASDLHGRCFPDDCWSADNFRRLLAAPGVQGWLLPAARGGEVPQALLLIRLAADEAEVLTLCVEATARRRGYAALLLREARPLLSAWGAQRLLLEVAEDNLAARSLYEGLGFRQVGRRPGYYSRSRAPAVDALLLSLDPL